VLVRHWKRVIADYKKYCGAVCEFVFFSYLCRPN
jgi:hypothetical protein